MHNIQQEIWKDITGFEGLYQISSKGNCRNIIYRNQLKPEVTKSGHLRVVLYNLKRNRKLLHRLVAIEFIENPHNKPCVCHKDNDPSNNNVTNLYWGTYKENTVQAVNDGRMNSVFTKGHTYSGKGQNNARASFTNIQVLAIRDAIYHGYSLGSIGRYFKTTKGTIWKIKAGYSWRSVR